MPQAEFNVGVVGHVDHGKTTLTSALTGKWTDTHSEELKRGITIKLGYADVVFKQCTRCGFSSTKERCPKCGAPTQATRKIAFLDAPGHETLMATVIAASSIMDGALFVIAANEKCPQPQTIEHLMILEAAGIKNVVIAQNKVDLVTRQQALEHYKQIREFLKGTTYENAPIIPTAANSGGNLDSLVSALLETIKPVPRESGKTRMLVARSFDVNKPGTNVEKLYGGIVGGSIVSGVLKNGEEVRILPGALRTHKGKEHYQELSTKIVGIRVGDETLEEAKPGGLVALATTLDPSLTGADVLVGCLLFPAKDEPPVVYQTFSLEITPLSRLLEKFPSSFTPNEPLVLGVGTATTVGFVTKQKKKICELMLKKPVCASKTDVIAVMRRANNRWRLYGTAKLVS
ncbi:Translation initiation factor 2 subunit gamma [Candidatus Norongarragalina meridionalis]|nr:Translation initiation factor 2 subunit gamma [Candidatus Norongarragalina meridionalis]